MPDELLNINREYVEAFIEHLLERWRSATANNRLDAFEVFGNRQFEEREIKERETDGENAPSDGSAVPS
jgi:hypothetical protein